MVFVSELGFPRHRATDQSGSVAPASNEKKDNKHSAQQTIPVPRNTPVNIEAQKIPVFTDDVVPTAVAVKSAANVDDTEPPSTTVSIGELETVAQDTVDRMARVRGMLMVAVDHDRQIADLVLDSLLLYGQARRSVKEVTELAKKSERQLAHVSKSYLANTLERATSSVQELEQYMQEVVTDYVALRKLISKLQYSTTETRRTMSAIARTRALAERRAFLRSAVHQVQLRLQQFPELSVHERSVREQLQSFAALEKFTNLPDSPEEQQALVAALEELEPIYETLQDSIAAIMERPVPTTDPTSDAELRTDTDWWSVDESTVAEDEMLATSSPAVEEPSAPYSTPTKTQSNKTNTAPETSAMSAERQPATSADEEVSASHSQKTTPTPAAEPVKIIASSVEAASPAAPVSSPTALTSLSQGLGNYRLQRGDTLVDIFLGDTDAGILPAMTEVPPSYINTLADLVRSYLDQYRAVREYLGTREAIDVWAMRVEGHPEISLDHMNDIVMYVAVRNEILTIAETSWQQLAATLGELEQQSDRLEQTFANDAFDFTPLSVRQRAQGQERGVRWASYGRQHDTATKRSINISSRSLLPQEAQVAWQQVIDDVYFGDVEAYESDLATWIETLFLAPHNRERLVGSVFGKTASATDSREDFLSLRFSDWFDLLHDTSLRYGWLQRHMVPASAWRDWSRQVLHWQRAIRKYSRDTVHSLPLLAVAELVFLDRSLQSQAR